MRILDQHERLPETCRTIVTVGNFDGIHRGHRRLLDEIVSRARSKKIKSVVITFDPHTRQVLNPDQPFPLLTSFDEKAQLIGDAGIDYLMRIPFTPEFSRHPPEHFIKEVLHQQLHAVEWVMGEGHGIGRDRIGEKNFLHTVLSKYHITPFTEDLMTQSDIIISSTQIRTNIIQGCITEAISMLGHPYLIAAERVSGKKIGTQLGFPTLNFARPPSQKVLPPAGVYAAELEYDGCHWPGALYFGDCPTFADRNVHFEFHALVNDPRFPGVGSMGMLHLHTFVRKDRTFSTKEELAVQIEKDVITIKHFFNEERGHAINQGT